MRNTTRYMVMIGLCALLLGCRPSPKAWPAPAFVPERSAAPTFSPAPTPTVAATLLPLPTRPVPNQTEPAVGTYIGLVDHTEIIDFVPTGVARDLGLVARACDTFVVGMAFAPAYRCFLPPWVSPGGQTYADIVGPCYVIPSREDVLRCATPLRSPRVGEDPAAPWGHIDAAGFLVTVPSGLADDIVKRRAEWRAPSSPVGPTITPAVGPIITLANDATCTPYTTQAPSIPCTRANR